MDADLKSVPAVSLGHVRLTLADCLGTLKLRCQLLPLLRAAVLEAFLLEEARRVGVSVMREELQAAADSFRRRHRLFSADDIGRWLAGQRLSAKEFETTLERDVLLEKLRERVTRDQIDDHFTQHSRDYDRARLSQIIVGEEELARELRNQLTEEEADFAELARHYSGDSSRVAGGHLGTVMRRQLSPAVAAAVFAGRPGDVVGPVPTPQGFHLLRVEVFPPTELDAATEAAIRQQLFDAWVAERLKDTPLLTPILDEL